VSCSVTVVAFRVVFSDTPFVLDASFLPICGPQSKTPRGKQFSSERLDLIFQESRVHVLARMRLSCVTLQARSDI
jgi:hypothetical protein